MSLASSATTSLTWQFSQYRPPTSSAGATTAAHTEVAAPWETVLNWNGSLPSAAASSLICLTICCICAGSIWRAKLGLYASWMYGRRADPALTMPLIESNCEEDVCGLRTPISQEGFVLRGLKV